MNEMLLKKIIMTENPEESEGISHPLMYFQFEKEEPLDCFGWIVSGGLNSNTNDEELGKKNFLNSDIEIIFALNARDPLITKIMDHFNRPEEKKNIVLKKFTTVGAAKVDEGKLILEIKVENPCLIGFKEELSVKKSTDLCFCYIKSQSIQFRDCGDGNKSFNFSNKSGKFI